MTTDKLPSQSIFRTVALSILAFACQVQARPVDMPPWVLKEGYFRITETANYFSTKANYEAARLAYQSLSGNQSLTGVESLTKVRYNFTDDISSYLGAGFNQVTVRSIGQEKTKTNFTDVLVGTDFYLTKTWMQLIAEMELSYAVDAIDKNTTNPLIHDGVHYGRFSIFGYKYTRYVNPYFHAGVKIPDEGMAKVFLYGFALENPFARKFLIGVGLEGEETLISDEIAETNRRTVTARVNAGSYKYYTYNPALLEAKAWFGFSPNPSWQMRIGLGSSIQGVRRAAGENIFFMLSYNFEPRPSREGFNYWVQDERSRQQSNRALKGFKVDPEKADQDLFADDLDTNAEDAKALKDTEQRLEQRQKK